MAVDTTAVKQKLARRADQAGTSPAPATQANGQERKPLRPEETVRRLLEQMKPELAKALPSHMTADRLARIALTEVRRNPALLECDRTSLLGAVMLSAQLGLEPGPLGHSYLIPRWNKKTGKKEAQFIIGYRGYLDLLYRSDRIESVLAQIVYEKDEFEIRYGVDNTLHHTPYLDGPRGKPRGAYIVVKMKGGAHFFRFLAVAEIEDRRKRSATPDAGPWVTDWEQMALKTVVRDASRWLPLSIEIQRAISQDEAVKAEIQPDMTEAIDVEFGVGEPVQAEAQPSGQPEQASEGEARASESEGEPPPTSHDEVPLESEQGLF